MRFLFFLLLLSSCGYHWGTSNEERCIAVPYIQGDDDGSLTAAVVNRVNQSSGLVYSSRSRDLELRVCLNPPAAENVGFWRAPQKKQLNAFTKIVVPMEGKLTLTAKVEVYDCQSNCRVYGPCKVSAYLDYDFNSDLTSYNDHAFSMGQLEMNNIAKIYAMRSAYNLLAEKIVDTVSHAW